MTEPPVPLTPESDTPEALEGPPWALCRVYAADGALLYAEAAADPGACFARHEGRRWWPRAARRTAAWYRGRADAEAAARDAVERERPAYNPGGGLLDAEAAAFRAGVSPSTWRSYVSRGQAPGADLPGRWRPEVVDAWKAARPGRGAGGGRPRKGAEMLDIARDRVVIEGVLAEAYEILTEATGDDFAHVADMRRATAGRVSWEDFDAVLTGLFARQEVNLVPQSCQARLTDEQRGGAILVGGEMKHRVYRG